MTDNVLFLYSSSCEDPLEKLDYSKSKALTTSYERDEIHDPYLLNLLKRNFILFLYTVIDTLCEDLLCTHPFCK